jgi:hypothetical protein
VYADAIARERAEEEAKVAADKAREAAEAAKEFEKALAMVSHLQCMASTLFT